MPKRSEKKSGNYYRKRIKGPDGKYHPIYGKTIAERDRKVAEQLALWAAEKAAGEQIYTVDYLRAWFARRSPGMSEQVRTVTRRHINSVLAPAIGEKLLAEITSDDLEEIMGSVAGKSRSYQKKLVQTIKQVFAAATAAGKIQRDPALALRAGGAAPAQKEALTEAEQAALLEAVAGLPVELFVKLGLYTGMRREEILGLQWDCVELSGSAPHVTVRRALRWPGNHLPEISEDLKNRAARRVIPIPPQLVSALRAAREADEGTPAQIARRPVIHAPDGGGIHYSGFRSIWHAVTVRSTASGRELGAKVPNHAYSVTIPRTVTPHILRHTYITRLILGGVDLKRVQYLAGHDDPEVTLKIYTSIMGHQPDDLIGAVLSVFGGGQAAEGVAAK